MKNTEPQMVHLAPDRCTKYRIPVVPSADELADWCHPRTSTQTDLADIAWTSEVVRSRRPLPKRLVGVWAHPDDEAYLSAGLMARVVEDGGSVTIVTLTNGEGGFAVDDPRPAQVRAGVRRSEMRAAMAEIGVHDVRFLGIADGGVGDASSTEVVAAIAAVLHEVRPDLVVTFGPDGITGHEDHIANWRLATQAWLQCGHGALWYAAKTHSWLEEWREVHDHFGVWMTDEPVGVSDDNIDQVIDLDERELERKRAVLAAHNSQTVGLAAAFGEDKYREWIAQEAFRPATSVELEAAHLGRDRHAELLGMVA